MSVTVEIPGFLTGPEIAQPHFCLHLLVKASHWPALARGEEKWMLPFAVRKGRAVPTGLRGTFHRHGHELPHRQSVSPQLGLPEVSSQHQQQGDLADSSLFYLISSLS